MKKLIIPLLVLISACSQKMTGTVTDIKGDTATISVTTIYRLRVDVIPGHGDTVTFKPTVNRKKINSKRL